MTTTTLRDPLAARPGDDETLQQILTDEGATRGLVLLLDCWANSPAIAKMTLQAGDGERADNPQVMMRAAAKTIRVLWNEARNHPV